MTTDAELYALAERLMPLKRTVQGIAVLKTLRTLNDWMTEPGREFMLQTTDVPVGTKVFDWEVLPDAKNRRAYHPTLEEVPAYDGPLTYAECVIKGSESREVLLSTYTCHPSMANDNVSGMVITAALLKWLASAPRRYTYRGLFAPETIGALCWLRSQAVETGGGNIKGHDIPRGLSLVHLTSPHNLQQIIAGYTINNCGDERAWSFLPSRKGDTLADRAARHVLDEECGMPPVRAWQREVMLHNRIPLDFGWTEYPFTDRGSDERQFCAPDVDLPIASVMRSKHGTYPEYHTPDDKLGVTVTAKGLGDTFRCYQRIIETIEANRTYRVTTIGEPRLDQHGLYPTTGGPDDTARIARDLCAFSDGQTDLIAIAEQTGRAVWDMAPIAQQLSDAGVLR